MVCGENLFSAAFWVVNDSTFQLDRACEEGEMGAVRSFPAGTFLAFSGRWHLAT